MKHAVHALVRCLPLISHWFSGSEDDGKHNRVEWTDETWNPVVGCTVLSPGCTNCYAMRMAKRCEAMDHGKYLGITRKSGGRAKWTGKLSLDPNTLQAPR